MNKYTKIGILVTPIVLSGAAVGTYYIVKKNDVHKKEQKSSKSLPTIKRMEKPETKSTQKLVFPNITFDEVYEDIVIEKGIPIINDTMIAKFIKLIFMRIKVASGEVKTKLFYNTRQEVDVMFEWILNGKVEATKIYKMKLKY